MINNKTFNVKLTKVEIQHLLTLLGERKDEGSYYGCKKYYYKRNDDLINKLESVENETRIRR